ncbi:MAG: glycosyltransferase family 4 protein [Ferruginibacter sp.]
MKPTIVHIIDDFGRGGAETMLVKVTHALTEYNNVVVTLYPRNEFEEKIGDSFYCLHLQSNLAIPKAAFQLRQIIKKHSAILVHSHLFWSTVVARLGTPRSVPLLTTIHAFVASSVEYQPLKMRVVEKLTYLYRKSTIIAVAKGALEEYFRFIKVKPHKAIALYTFVDTEIFKATADTNKAYSDDIFSLVTVGNLKGQKNHHFLLEAFKQLKNEPIHLDIYGNGVLENELQQIIDEHQLKVHLKGQVQNIQDRLMGYNLFVMSSHYEGFALSVLEAMALGMPLLLSDIASFKEQCADTALYFSIKNTDEFVAKVKALSKNPEQLKALSIATKERVLAHFTFTHHMQQLREIYLENTNVTC